MSLLRRSAAAAVAAGAADWPQAPPRPWASPWRALGAPGWAGIAGLLLALVLGAVLAPHWQARAEQLHAQARSERIAAADAARRLRSDPALATRNVPTAAPWPAATQRLARIDRLLALAREHGVQVLGAQHAPGARGALRPADADADATAPVWSTVTLPARARYADLRRFVAAALAADSALALDAVRLERQPDEGVALRVELVFGLASAAGAEGRS
jgi:hypothetical protein